MKAGDKVKIDPQLDSPYAGETGILKYLDDDFIEPQWIMVVDGSKDENTKGDLIGIYEHEISLCEGAQKKS